MGGAASKFQTTLTIVGGALSLAVIVALYFARKMQIEKFRVEQQQYQPEAGAEPSEPTTESEPTGEVEVESLPDLSEDVTATEPGEPTESTEPDDEIVESPSDEPLEPDSSANGQDNGDES